MNNIKHSTLAIIALLLFFSAPAFAELKSFEKEYTYQASEFDSKASSRTIALEQVKRLLLEELGTYLESSTEVKDFQLTKDRIVALTAGVVHTHVIDEKWDGRNYWLKAVIKADPENVARSLDTLRKDQKKSDDLEEIRRKSDQSLKEIEHLQSEVTSLKNDIKAKETYNKNVATLKQDTDPRKASSPKSKPQQAKKQAAKPSDAENKYYASSKSKKYHYPSCRWAQNINPSNLVSFKSANDANAQGYVPCKVCKPPLSD
ncbi:MAG: Ada metal-binding domain-containing protein [Deltaproteobacteria bacterium]